MDAIKRRSQIHRACAERVVDAAAHVAWQIRPPPQHLRWRRPARPFLFRGNAMGSAPAEAVAADADAVAQRLAVGQYQIESPLGGVYVNCSRCVIAGEVDGGALDRARSASAAAAPVIRAATAEYVEKVVFLGLRMAGSRHYHQHRK